MELEETEWDITFQELERILASWKTVRDRDRTVLELISRLKEAEQESCASSVEYLKTSSASKELALGERALELLPYLVYRPFMTEEKALQLKAIVTPIPSFESEDKRAQSIVAQDGQPIPRSIRIVQPSALTMPILQYQ